LPEGFQDHSVFEFADVRIAAPGEGDRADIGLVKGHGLRAPDRGGAMWTFDGFTRREPAFD
jgi:hypothetical protein